MGENNPGSRWLARALLILATIPAGGAPHRDWKTAKLIEMQRLDPSNQLYRFDLGDTVVTCADSISWTRVRLVPLAVGSKVRYEREGHSRLIFLDEKAREHKCEIRNEIAKTPSP